jgi:hypothetical protein
MKTPIVCTLTALWAICLSAATPEHLARINKFFEVTQMQKQYETSLVSGFSAATSAQQEGLPEDEQATFEKTMQRAKDFLLREMGWPKVKDEMAELYARHFSEEDVEKIIKLLDNDTGRMLSSKQIALLPDSMAFAQKKMRELMPKLMAAMQDEPAEPTQRSKSLTCVNNLKQIGLAFKLWALDHEDLYSFQVRTNKGGTLELCSRNKDNADSGACFHFQVMSNELSTPTLLVCPGDSGKVAAEKFAALQATNVSYLLFSGRNVSESNPQEVLARCPVHNHVLRCDGSVEKGK